MYSGICSNKSCKSIKNPIDNSVGSRYNPCRVKGKEVSHIIIQHYQFPIRDPYKEGHVLTDVEANVLNWHRANLIQKTTQRWVIEAANGSEDLLSMEELDKIAWRIKEFDQAYELSARKAPRKAALEYHLDAVASGILLRAGEFEPSEEDLERVKRTPEVQERARDLVRASNFSQEDLLS